MKAIVLKIGLILFIMISCSDPNKNTNVSIETISDVIGLDEIYTANLRVSHLDTVFPEFSIIINSDTFLIAYERKLGCAVFKARGTNIGKKVYNGQVKYVNKTGDRINEKFEINFIVK